MITLSLGGFGAEAAAWPAYTRAFCRYSADRVHWSSWYRLAPTAPVTSLVSTEFESWLELPRAASERYEELKTEWWQTQPVWSSDEHEFCIWLAAHHRDYFDTEVPLVGYVQVRVEGDAHQVHVASMTVWFSSDPGGLESIPRGPRRPTADGPWFFDLAKLGR
jgi:hypothetical protein